MRRLSAGEHGMLTDVFVELEEHLSLARWHAERARRDGGQSEAYVELDHAASSLDDLTKLAEELAPVIERLTRAVRKETTPRSKPPVLARDRRRPGAAA